MAYKRVVRNYDNIQHEKVKRVVDPQYNDFHDDLSEAYYDGLLFKHQWLKQWGYPKEIDFAALKVSNPAGAKAVFDELHGLNEEYRGVKFHQHNKSLPMAEQIPETEYNDIVDENGVVIGKNSDKAIQRIDKIKATKGFELVVE